MQNTINTIIALLKSGMTTGHSVSDDYYVKVWYTGDPLAAPNTQLTSPSAAVIPSIPNPRDAQYVGEDNITETILIRFYQSANRKAGEAAEVAAGMTRLIAMFERAESLLRTDPTFGSTFVNTKITNINPLLPGVADANVFRIAEITLETTSRAVWGAMNNIPPVINYTLIYTAGANGSITGTSPQSVSYLGSGTPVTAVPDSGYSFLNWSDNSIDNPRTDINVTNNVSVTANFIGDDMLFNTQNDESGNKLFDTVYQNQNAVPIMVSVSVNLVIDFDSGSPPIINGMSDLSAKCSSANPPTDYAARISLNVTLHEALDSTSPQDIISEDKHFSFIVPADYYYTLVTTAQDGGTVPSIDSWIEYGGIGTAV